MTIVVSAVTAVLCAVIIMILRYWLLPEIEQFHGKISAALTSAMGNPVSIGKIKGDWDGLHPHLNFTDVRILDALGKPALVLPRIDASVSWLSLLAAELRLSSLEIDRPELLIRQDTQGRIFIGSVAMKSEGSNNDLANWLLHQSHMAVHNAVIVWLDEQHGAPPLVLDRVNLRIESLFDHHQFALLAVPPIELSSPLDVRGDFHGSRFDEPDKWNGQLFTQLDYSNILAWRPWIKLPDELSRGQGAFRSWLGVTNGKISQFTADLVLHDVATRLADNVPEMDVHFLRGRAAWKTVEDGWEVSTRKLSMRLHNGVRLQPTDFYLRLVQEGQKHPAGGELRANTLQLESLVSLANFLPLDAKLRTQLNSYAPRGHVSNLDMEWQGSPDKLLGYKIFGQFDKLALQQAGSMPGFSGLSVTVDGNEAQGHLNINTRNLTLEAPGVMREPLLFSTLTGQVSWQREKGELKIRADNVALANDDLAGNLYGNFHTQPGTLGVLDLTASLTRGDIKHAARYTPLVALDKKDNDWLNDALLSGHTEDFRLRLKGNLSDFPLDGTTDTSLEIGAHAEDVSMKFARDWPVIEKLSGEFSIHNNKLEVDAPTASILGARISHLSIIQPDMSDADPRLQIKGEADAANNIFLQFIQQSPVRGYINGFTDGISGSGSGHLNLSAQIPLLSSKPAKISGLLRVQASDIDMGPGVPLLRNTTGELSFSESAMKAVNVTSDILGGPAHLDLQTAAGGVVQASLQGSTTMDGLRKSVSHPLLDRLQGGTTWDANISVVNKTAQLTVNSSLEGISSSLPAPFTKSAAESWPLHIEKHPLDAPQELISARLGKVLSVKVLRNAENGVNVISRGVIRFGEPENDTLPDKNGIWLTGRLPVLSLRGWEGVSGGAGQSLPIAGANLHIDKVTGSGFNLNNLQINAQRRGDGLSAQLSSPAVGGEVVWQPNGYNGTGKLSVKLQNLYWTEAAALPEIQAKTVTGDARPNDLPALDITVDDVLFKGKKIGHLEMQGYPEGKNWRLRHLHITNPDGSVTGDGLWQGEKANTQVNLLLEISNAGNILARSGYPNTVKNGSGKLAARMAWDGSPDEFNYSSLSGTLKLDTGKGQFLKMDPGFGKLLGILSLQALPKRITLDFTDVFSDGFEFDHINGNAAIHRGVMQTQDLFIDGSSAKVAMKGLVNLNDETQNLHVEILPTLGSSVSMLSTFAAGPVIGLGTLIVSKILGNPLDNLMSFAYNVSGTWSNPSVIKVGEKPVKVQTLPKTP
ncbi:MAG: YhdP family protein [Gallionella sp.]|nr:YhdP family protein [Gallionella sp.]